MPELIAKIIDSRKKLELSHRAELLARVENEARSREAEDVVSKLKASIDEQKKVIELLQTQAQYDELKQVESYLRRVQKILAARESGHWPRSKPDELGFHFTYQFSGIDYYLPTKQIEFAQLKQAMSWEPEAEAMWQGYFNESAEIIKSNGWNLAYLMNKAMFRYDRFELYQQVSFKINALKKLLTQLMGQVDEYEGESLTVYQALEKEKVALRGLVARYQAACENKKSFAAKLSEVVGTVAEQKALIDKLAQLDAIDKNMKIASTRMKIKLGRFANKQKYLTQLQQSKLLLADAQKKVDALFSVIDTTKLLDDDEKAHFKEWQHNYYELKHQLEDFIQAHIKAEPALSSFFARSLEKETSCKQRRSELGEYHIAALNRYLEHRKEVYYFYDLWDGFFALVLGCIFAYKTESAKRKDFIENKLTPQIEYYINTGEDETLKDLITEGLDTFKPRTYHGPENIFSLHYQLKGLYENIDSSSSPSVSVQ